MLIRGSLWRGIEMGMKGSEENLKIGSKAVKKKTRGKQVTT